MISIKLKNKLYILLMVLLISPILSITSNVIMVKAADTNTLGGDKSYQHRRVAGYLYDGSISPDSSGRDRWLLSSYKSARTSWHNFIPGGYNSSTVRVDAVGLENPNSYRPPTGWEVHGILKYPVYTPRHYAVSIRDCGGKTDNDAGSGRCHPHNFEPGRPENQWAIQNISFGSWDFDRREQTWEGKTGPFYIFDAAERLYAYDIRIVKKGGPPPVDPCKTNPNAPGCGGGGDGGGGDPPPEPPPNPCDSGGCEEVILTCPPPYHPPDIDRPFEYRLDLVTERIEGQTVEKGTQTHTPVTVYRADFSDYRQAIKDRLNAAISTNNALKANCESNILTMQSNLSSLYSKQSEIESILSSCQATPNMDCSNVQNGLSQVMSAIGSQNAAISAAMSMLPLYDEKIQQILNYLQTIYEAEARYRIINTSVDLTYKSKPTNLTSFISRKPVALAENDRKILDYYWILNDDGFVKAFIDPDDEYTACPKPGGACETNEANNIKEAPIYIASHETVLSCSREGETSQLSGITRTVTTSSGTQIFRETAASTLTIDPQEKQRRAGFGFYYKVNTNYKNEDIAPTRSTIGTTKASPYKPAILASYLPYTYQNWQAPYSFTHGITQSNLKIEGYKVPNMFVKNMSQQNVNGQTYQQAKEWELPQYSIERYSGNIFEGNLSLAAVNPQHNPSDELLDGGRKWYLDFMQPDGAFVYDVLIPDVGVNKLNLCVTGEVEVIGTFTGDENGDDDFVYRSIDSTNAFPSGTGWNWKGYESIISSISDWWTEWFYPNPKEVPNGFHEEHYELPTSTKKQIREENESQSTDIVPGNGFMDRYGF